MDGVCAERGGGYKRGLGNLDGSTDCLFVNMFIGFIDLLFWLCVYGRIDRESYIRHLAIWRGEWKGWDLNSISDHSPNSSLE